eukprot:gene6849-11010_t
MNQPNFWHESQEDNYIQLIEYDGNYIKRAPKDILQSLKVAKTCVKLNPKTLRYFDKNIRDNDELFDQCFQNKKRFLKSFKYFSPRLRNNKKIILEIIAENLMIYRVINEEMRSDKEIIWKMFQNPELLYAYPNYKKIPNVIRKDKKFLMKLMSTTNYVPHLLPYEFWCDKEVMMETLKYFGSHMKTLPEKLKNDIDLATIVITYAPWEYSVIGDVLKNDYLVVLSMLKKQPEIYPYISEEFKNEETTDIYINAPLLYTSIKGVPYKFISKFIFKQLETFENSTEKKTLKYKLANGINDYLTTKFYLYDQLYFENSWRDEIYPLDKVNQADSYDIMFLLKIHGMHSFDKLETIKDINFSFA